MRKLSFANPTTKITNDTLYKYHMEIQSYVMMNSIQLQWNRSKINDLYNNNGIRINGLIDAMNEVTAKYYEFAKKGGKGESWEMKYDENKKPILIEGAKEEDYQKDMHELMSRKISVPL